MKDRVLVGSLADHVADQVLVCGWVHRLRSLGGISFLMLRDRSGIAQLVIHGSPDVTLESVISARGTVAGNPKAPGGMELQVADWELVAPAESELPIPVNQDPGKLSLEALLDNRMLSLRNPKVLSIFRVQATLLQAFADHLRGQDFTEIKTAKLVGSGTEGGAGLFAVEYFESKVFLAQSPQLYKQALVAAGLERVFEIGNAYRAEKHDTPRHINEYVSLDVEMAFIDTEHDLMDLELGILKALFGAVRQHNLTDLEAWEASVPTDEEVDAIPRLRYREAIDRLRTLTGTRVFEVNPEGERLLCEWALQEHGVEACFVHGDPRRKRPFYAFPDGKDTRSFDLMFRGLEITTGGRRINDYAMLKDSIEQFGLSPESLRDYLQIFRFGCPPHGGFAIGLERLTQKILGLANVKEASLFPRDRRRVRP